MTIAKHAPTRIFHVKESRPLSVNPDIDPQIYAPILQKNKRLQIQNFLDKESATQIHSLLTSNKKWYLSYNEPGGFFETPLEEFIALSPVQRSRFIQNIYQRARNNFQFMFNHYYISQAINNGEDKGHPLHAVHEFVNTAKFLDFMRTLTGEQSINDADSFASQYAPGHFLTKHDDIHDQDDRVAAYVISMNPVWQESWGGHLAFYDSIGNIEDAFIPSFNTLNIFLIPQSHAVQMVSPFAGAARNSLLGWLRR